MWFTFNYIWNKDRSLISILIVFNYVDNRVNSQQINAMTTKPKKRISTTSTGATFVRIESLGKTCCKMAKAEAQIQSNIRNQKNFTISNLEI